MLKLLTALFVLITPAFADDQPQRPTGNEVRAFCGPVGQQLCAFGPNVECPDGFQFVFRLDHSIACASEVRNPSTGPGVAIVAPAPCCGR